jgi:hypothetical protein
VGTVRRKKARSKPDDLLNEDGHAVILPFVCFRMRGLRCFRMWSSIGFMDVIATARERFRHRPIAEKRAFAADNGIPFSTFMKVIYGYVADHRHSTVEKIRVGLEKGNGEQWEDARPPINLEDGEK